VTADLSHTVLSHADPGLVVQLQAIAETRQLVTLSLGAGVQSTALALMAAAGELSPMPDVALFADTGWEPRSVYAHLERLEAALPFPVIRVSGGNIRDDLTSATGRFAAIPYYTQREPGPCQRCDEDGTVEKANPVTDELERVKCARCKGTKHDDGRGIGRRQCTKEYKLEPIRRALRILLGAKGPRYRSVPKGRTAVQWVGFSTDEVGRANRRKDSHGVAYLDTRYPLLEDPVDMSRDDCDRWLEAAGWGAVAKSACIGCPYHGNRQWRDMRDQQPADWQDALEVDRMIRKGAGGGAISLDGQAFLHRSRVPLDLAPIDHVTRTEWKDRQLNLLDVSAETGRAAACSPFGCEDDPDDEEAA
jgi:hypothetical protein